MSTSHRDVVGMVTFAELEQSAPTIAAFASERIAKTGLCLVGTTRHDGWPRISPMELTVFDGMLYVGSMPNAVKARDLQRDPRCCVITPLADKDDLAGEVKMFCRARELTESDEWQALRVHMQELVGFDIGEPGGSHLFELGIESAAWQRVEGDDWRTTSWSTGTDRVRERVRTGPLGESRDL
jgi:nitroimidazol reductase NimA-like FMN-containing flavoprotein (pyridoxamine 5'-phosphate oxidase superfamily)